MRLGHGPVGAVGLKTDCNQMVTQGWAGEMSPIATNGYF